jgi:hypothetical protein
VRIMVLAEELRDQARRNTATSRERCRRISAEFVELLNVEDTYHVNDRFPDHSRRESM